MEGTILSAEKLVKSVSGTLLKEMVADHRACENKGELYV